MASRVNTKFVVILIVAVVAMLGMLFAAYSVVYKSPDDLAARGDQFMSEGKVNEARKAYARAVNKDPTRVENLEKWIDALEQWIPETETAYYDAFRTDYLGAIHQASVVQRTNVEAYERELNLQYTRLLQQYSRGSADALIARTKDVLGFFDGVPGVDPGWQKLRRYRAMAWERIGANNGIIEEQMFELVNEDFEAALAVSPDDDEMISFYMRWIVYEATHSSDGGTPAKINEARARALEMGRAFLADHPNSSSVAVSHFAINMEDARAEVSSTNPELSAARTQAIYDTFAVFQEDFTKLYDKLMSLPAEELHIRAVHNFHLIELLVYPESDLPMSISMFKRILEARPQSPTLILSLAEILTTTGQTEEGLALYDKIVNHPLIPLSIDGVNLFNAKRSAYIAMAVLFLDEYQTLNAQEDSDPDELASLLTKATTARDEFAELVPEDNLTLTLLDGRLAYANGKTEESLRLFKSYNSQRSEPDIRGLWFESVAALDLNQLGTAKQALENLLTVQKSSVPAIVRLAQIEIRLENLSAAKLLFEQVLVYQPDNFVAKDSIARINAMENPALIEDPVQSLLVTARLVRRGNDESTGDISGAITVLSEGIESVGYAPQVTQELASMLVDQGDIVGAREVLARAVEAHPEDDRLEKMRNALQNDDEVSILVSMIENSPIGRVEQLLSIANVAMTRNARELYNDTVDELLELAPDDGRVIDLAFVRAINDDDVQTARLLTERGKANNSDGVQGLSFEARLAAMEGNTARAITLLEQVTASGSADSMFHRMLALQYQEDGRMSAAINSFENALAIRPDDKATIIEFLRALVRAGQYPEALDIARRFQRYANDNPQFVTIWLSLESSFGGAVGQAFAIKQREKFLELDPNDMGNKFALASLYVDTKKWNEARVLIDQLKAHEDLLQYTNLEANWYANQGRVGDQSGLGAALEVYQQYIARHADEENARPYIGLARFMLDRGRPDIAVQAASDAVERENPETLDGTKLLGDLFIMLNQYSNAADAFEKVVDAGADSDDEYRLRLIDMLIRTRQFQKAKDQFQLLDPARSTMVVPMLQNAEIEEGLDNRSAASDILDQAVAQYSDNTMVYIKRAEFNSGTPEGMTDVLADIDAALKINSDDWRAYRIRAAAYFAVDDRAKALRDLQRAVRLNPSLDQALFGIINELMIDGRNAEAYDFANEIVQARKQDASLTDSLGQIFATRQDWERATQFYKLTWQNQRSPNAGATLIDAIVRTRNPDTALANSVINDLTEIAGKIDESPGLLAAQALVLQARGRDQLALQQLTKAFDLSSDRDADLLQWSGNISRFFEGQPMQDQINYLESLKRRNPNQEVLNWLDLFITQRMINVGAQLDAAFANLERLADISSQPEIQRLALTSHGSAKYTLGELDEAVALWGKGAEMFPNDWEMSNNLAYVLSTELGKHEQALELAKKSLEVTQNRSEPYDTIGMIYIALGDYENAQEMLNEGMKYALSARARVTLVLAQIELDLARGLNAEARSKVVEIRSLMRSMPTRDVRLEEQVDEIEAKIDSDG